MNEGMNLLADRWVKEWDDGQVGRWMNNDYKLVSEWMDGLMG